MGINYLGVAPEKPYALDHLTSLLILKSIFRIS